LQQHGILAPRCDEDTLELPDYILGLMMVVVGLEVLVELASNISENQPPIE